jgi:hypothetical protein
MGNVRFGQKRIDSLFDYPIGKGRECKLKLKPKWTRDDHSAGGIGEFLVPLGTGRVPQSWPKTLTNGGDQ